MESLGWGRRPRGIALTGRQGEREHSSGRVSTSTLCKGKEPSACGDRPCHGSRSVGPQSQVGARL